ncbi:MAG: hypothetical protein L7S70_05745 [Pseudomonadales bacterium]|nr:hypothetical protein [Pseudomonadales bacterium]
MNRYIAVLVTPTTLPYCLEIESGSLDQALDLVKSEKEKASLLQCHFIIDLEAKEIHRVHQEAGEMSIVGGAFDALGLATDMEFFKAQE